MNRRRAVLTIAAGLTAPGCALFGKPSDEVSFNRGQFTIVVIRLAEMHGVILALAGLACKAAKTPVVVDLCRELEKAEMEWQRLKVPVERSITDPRIVPDWQAIIKGFEVLTTVIATVAPALGVPALGAIGALGGLGGLLK